MGRSRLIHSPAALGAGKQRERWRFDFMGASKWFFSMSGVILLIGALAIGGKGLNFGIDFESGTRDQDRRSTSRPTRTTCATRSRRSGFARRQDPARQRPGARARTSSRSRPTTLDAAPARRRSSRTLQQKFGVKSLRLRHRSGRRSARPSPSSAMIAIIASLLVISLYIALRFEWKYAVPVLIALMHDLLITGGRLLADRPGGDDVDGRGAADHPRLLALRHDHRVRPHPRERAAHAARRLLADRQPLDERGPDPLAGDVVLHRCCRSLALLLFGGETLKDFAFALLVGVISGTYSSIFIASPVLTHWKEREPVYVRRRRRIAEENGGVVPAYARGAPAARRSTSPRADKQRGARRITAARGPGARRLAGRVRRDGARPARRRRRRRADGRARARPQPPTSTPRTSCSRTTSPRRPSPSGRATSATGGAARWPCSPGS